MATLLLNPLKRLETKNSHIKKQSEKLNVYYGWSRINKVQKKEAIAVFFENEPFAGDDIRRSSKTMKKLIDVVAVRPQTEKEMEDAAFCNRVFSVYYVFLDDKAVKGSLKTALDINSQADCNHVSEELRKEISDKLRKRYMETHPDYQEPE